MMTGRNVTTTGSKALQGIDPSPQLLGLALFSCCRWLNVMSSYTFLISSVLEEAGFAPCHQGSGNPPSQAEKG